jgi:hypothetical protein
MNKRLVIASALAAAVAAPSLVMAQNGPAPAPTFKAEKCQGRQKRLRLDRQQLLRRHLQGQRRPEGVGLRARGLLRPPRQRQQDAEGLNAPLRGSP